VVGGCDLFHHTNYLRPPVSARVPEVMTIHDLTFIENEVWHEPRAAKALLRVVERARAECAAFCVPSEATARACRERLGIEPGRIYVTPLGVEARWFTLRESTGPYLLAVGTLEPRKNHARLIRAFRAARLPGLTLRIAGMKGWLCDEVFAEAARTPGVELLGHVGESELERLVAGASAVVYPTLAEGFGLPVLEAMAAGRPVLTSSVEPLASLAGEAALLVDPGDVAALTDGLRRIVADDALRARLERAGPDRARAFTWNACAEATVRCYRAVIGK
jgi:glycosyltransferase involved in cell wall biosynthesis